MTVALCGLAGAAGAVYAADQAAQPAKPDINQEIVQQLVNEGQRANAAPNAPAENPYTAEQMLILAPKYTADMQTAIDHAEDVRLIAYRSHDIIRMTCVDDKIGQMKTLSKMAVDADAHAPHLQGGADRDADAVRRRSAARTIA